MNKLLVKFHWDCGRMGDVRGLFVTTKEELEGTYGKQIYFGEILGKHSEVSGPLEQSDIEIVSEDQDFISKLVVLMGLTISGHNPLSYLEE